MVVNLKELTPSIAIHPGEMLNDELKVRGITQKEFSQITGIPHSQLNEIIKGKRGIYADIALVIGKALNMDATLWTNLQMNYELDLAKINNKNKARLEAISIWEMIKSYIPVKFFKKQRVISGDPIKDIHVIKEIYKISNIEQLASVYSQNCYAMFKKSDKLSTDKINLVGWVKLVNYRASKIKVAKFDSAKRYELIDTLNAIFRKNKNTIDKTQKILASYGIKLVTQVHPEKCAVDGISFWSEGNPAIGMTIRHKRIDNFAFTVFHELGHVFLHLINNNTAEYIDLDKENSNNEYKNCKEEIEANEFAKNAMINKNDWEIFIKDNTGFSESSVRSFANKQKIHPAIVQGRFLFETNFFKVRSSIKKELQ